MLQLGDPVVMMAVFSFQRSSIAINPQMWSKSVVLLVLTIGIIVWSTGT
jgi:hypothetical protein